ncbi:MAG TPA: hypothetical protein VLB76_12165 [Thermoanaerobaculia bacterium]|jgi:hypothetical protein|nr:hypothetical protein [Thermoanaerobaculia bacterium]
MIVRPMIGSWQVPRIERIGSHEARRFGVLPVPGLSGDLHQDLGRSALRVEIAGSLTGDEARDGFLAELRRKLYAAEPVDFVADIAHDSQLEQVLLEVLDVEEVAGTPGSFRYRVVLREHTEPPRPADGAVSAIAGIGLSAGGGAAAGFSPEALAGVEASLAAEISAGLDLLDVPALLAPVSLPRISDLLAPVREAGSALKNILKAGTGTALQGLRELLPGTSAPEAPP